MTSTQRKTARWRYVVPNAITCCGVLIGLTSCFRAMAGLYEEAAWLIVLCVLLDKLDGTAARLLNATSQIGLQLDSFSDFVTFGIAPGTLVYMMIVGTDPGAIRFEMWDGPTIAWLLRALVATYVLCACIRLAKFNVLPEDPDGPKVFYGMPTTFCGAIVSSLLLVMMGHGWDADLTPWMPVVLASLGLLMVSNVPMPKVVKQPSMAVNIMIVAGLVVGYAAGLLRIYPEVLLVLIAVYLVWAAVWVVRHWELLGKRNLDPYPD